jgi:SAM-dependent methyltransferase
MTAAQPTCRSCGSGPLAPILSLGDLPLANALLTAAQFDEPDARYPLDLAFCAGCALVQLTHTVPPEQMFREYLYFSSFADTALREAEALSRRLIAGERLDEAMLVVEIGSNDGYLLQHYKAAGIPVLGIEPAINIARVAEAERGVPTIVEFFDAALATKLVSAGTRPVVVHANNVLAHVPDLNGFVRGVRTMLGPSGLAVFEVPYVKDLIDHDEFDTIYHEHLCYFSLTALDALFRRHDLDIRDVERLAIHGGSLRVFVRPVGCAPAATAAESDRVVQLLADEAAWGVHTASFYDAFASRVERVGRALRERLAELKRNGRRIAAYGAAAKGTVLLNYLGLGRETLDFVVDRNPYKQGRFVPGVRLPIVGTEQLVARMPDYVLLLAWNFADEIMSQQAEYRSRGGQFLLPLAEARAV